MPQLVDETGVYGERRLSSSKKEIFASTDLGCLP